jgi:hypothetical protein
MNDDSAHRSHGEEDREPHCNIGILLLVYMFICVLGNSVVARILSPSHTGIKVNFCPDLFTLVRTVNSNIIANCTAQPYKATHHFSYDNRQVD